MQKINSIIKNLKILYVEDDDITRIITKKILNKIVDKLLIAKNGQEGLELFKLHKPDVIITDLRMPLLNGIDFIKQIRAIDSDSGIIITSEVEDVKSIIKTIDIGIDNYLIKPITDFDIINSLQLTTSKLLSRKFNKDKLDTLLMFNKEQKRLIEINVKSKISAFIKQHMGKGPKDIKVYFIKNTLQIKAYDVLTSMEKTLLENKNNVMLIQYNRHLFYENKRFYLETLLGNILNKTIQLTNINIDILENSDELIATYSTLKPLNT